MVNPYVVVPLVVWAIAQFLKFVIAALRGKVDFRNLYSSGGMPSVHAAVVSSLAITALLVDGHNSAAFGITVIFAAMVMYDAFGVRRAVGEQAVALNAILEAAPPSDGLHPAQRLREVLGHKPIEVFAGACLGIALGILFNYQRADVLFKFLATPVQLRYVYALAAFSAILLIVGAVIRFWVARPYRDVLLARKAASRIWLLAWLGGLVGGLLAFMQYEKIPAALWMVWSVLYLIVVIKVATLLMWRYYRALPPALAARQESEQKRRWFEGPNKKRRKAARNKKRK